MQLHMYDGVSLSCRPECIILCTREESSSTVVMFDDECEASDRMALPCCASASAVPGMGGAGMVVSAEESSMIRS